MIYSQNSWNNCGEPISTLFIDDSWEKPQIKQQEKQGFEIAPFLPNVFLLGAEAVWKSKKPPQQKKLSPEIIQAIALLDSWENEDPQEQRETWEYLVRVLDEDRLSYRKLFP